MFQEFSWNFFEDSCSSSQSFLKILFVIFLLWRKIQQNSSKRFRKLTNFILNASEIYQIFSSIFQILVFFFCFLIHSIFRKFHQQILINFSKIFGKFIRLAIICASAREKGPIGLF